MFVVYMEHLSFANHSVHNPCLILLENPQGTRVHQVNSTLLLNMRKIIN